MSLTILAILLPRVIYNGPMRRINIASLILMLLLPLVAVALTLLPIRQAEAARLLQQMKLARARNQPGEAVQALDALLELQPWREELFEPLGDLRQQTGDMSGAMDAYEAARQAGSLSAQGAVNLAALFVNHQQNDRARDLLVEFTGENRFDGATFPKVIDLLQVSGRPEDLLLALAAWLEQDPTNAQALYLKGIYLAPTDAAGAALALEQAGAKDARYQASAMTLLKALDATAAEADPGLAALEIGRGLVEVEEWHAAEAAFERCVAVRPDLAESWAFLGEARQKLGMPGSEEIERALALSPDLNTVQALAAIHYRRAGRPDVSLVYLHAAANEEPGSAYWQVELGKALSDLNDIQDALLHFLKATELEPGIAQNWIELARFSLNFNIEVERVGLPAARKALTLAPEDANALDIMGALLFSQNDLASAERFLQQSLQQDAANADAQLHLGQVYLATGDLAAARPYLDEAARLTPETAVGKLAERLVQKYYPTR